jgi:hypothetical protein
MKERRHLGRFDPYEGGEASGIRGGRLDAPERAKLSKPNLSISEKEAKKANEEAKRRTETFNRGLKKAKEVADNAGARDVTTLDAAQHIADYLANGGDLDAWHVTAARVLNESSKGLVDMRKNYGADPDSEHPDIKALQASILSPKNELSEAAYHARIHIAKMLVDATKAVETKLKDKKGQELITALNNDLTDVDRILIPDLVKQKEKEAGVERVWLPEKLRSTPEEKRRENYKKDIKAIQQKSGLSAAASREDPIAHLAHVFDHPENIDAYAVRLANYFTERVAEMSDPDKTYTDDNPGNHANFNEIKTSIKDTGEVSNGAYKAMRALNTFIVAKEKEARTNLDSKGPETLTDVERLLLSSLVRRKEKKGDKEEKTGAVRRFVERRQENWRTKREIKKETAEAARNERVLAAKRRKEESELAHELMMAKLRTQIDKLPLEGEAGETMVSNPVVVPESETSQQVTGSSQVKGKEKEIISSEQEGADAEKKIANSQTESEQKVIPSGSPRRSGESSSKATSKLEFEAENLGTGNKVKKREKVWGGLKGFFSRKKRGGTSSVTSQNIPQGAMSRDSLGAGSEQEEEHDNNSHISGPGAESASDQVNPYAPGSSNWNNAGIDIAPRQPGPLGMGEEYEVPDRQLHSSTGSQAEASSQINPKEGILPDKKIAGKGKTVVRSPVPEKKWGFKWLWGKIQPETFISNSKGSGETKVYKHELPSENSQVAGSTKAASFTDKGVGQEDGREDQRRENEGDQDESQLPGKTSNYVSPVNSRSDVAERDYHAGIRLTSEPIIIGETGNSNGLDPSDSSFDEVESAIPLVDIDTSKEAAEKRREDFEKALKKIRDSNGFDTPDVITYEYLYKPVHNEAYYRIRDLCIERSEVMMKIIEAKCHNSEEFERVNNDGHELEMMDFVRYFEYISSSAEDESGVERLVYVHNHLLGQRSEEIAKARRARDNSEELTPYDDFVLSVNPDVDSEAEDSNESLQRLLSPEEVERMEERDKRNKNFKKKLQTLEEEGEGRRVLFKVNENYFGVPRRDDFYPKVRDLFIQRYNEMVKDINTRGDNFSLDMKGQKDDYSPTQAAFRGYYRSVVEGILTTDSKDVQIFLIKERAKQLEDTALIDGPTLNVHKYETFEQGLEKVNRGAKEQGEEMPRGLSLDASYLAYGSENAFHYYFRELFIKRSGMLIDAYKAKYPNSEIFVDREENKKTRPLHVKFVHYYDRISNSSIEDISTEDGDSDEIYEVLRVHDFLVKQRNEEIDDAYNKGENLNSYQRFIMKHRPRPSGAASS